MDLLENPIRDYVWGSRVAIAALQGRATPTARPEAELWMGAHASAPSFVARGGDRQSLLTAVRADPAGELGPRVAQQFGGEFPFLLKVLAAETPLSLQAHPTESQAQEGFSREEQLGVPIDATSRNYRDARHKPELIVALSKFEALCGFRDPKEAADLFRTLACSTLAKSIARLEATLDTASLRDVFLEWTTLDPHERPPRIGDVLASCAAHASDARFGDAFAWAVRLGHAYPGDAGAVTSLLLNYVQLRPREALYLPAGNLHAYLRGVGVEVMANSDNVLRGGLTQKHVDVAELTRVLTFDHGPVRVLWPDDRAQGESRYDTPAREFELSRLVVGDAGIARRNVRGPEIVLCTMGALEITTDDATRLELASGASAYIAAGDGAYIVRGHGEAFRAAVP